MKPLGGGVLARASGVSATFQNNLLRRVDLASSYDRLLDQQPAEASRPADANTRQQGGEGPQASVQTGRDR